MFLSIALVPYNISNSLETKVNHKPVDRTVTQSYLIVALDSFKYLTSVYCIVIFFHICFTKSECHENNKAL